MGTPIQDMRNMGGLKRWMPWTWALMWVATLAIAGIPPLAGFFSKDEILASAFGRGAGAGVFYGLWALASIASLITAIYMARLMALTFHGENRTGAEAQAHLHEAPWVMTGPLLVLGVLSAVGGFLNGPHVLGGHAWLHEWLEPVLAPANAIAPAQLPSHTTELVLIGIATLLGAAGLVLGFRATMRTPAVPAAEAAPERGFGGLLAAQYHVDRIYDRLIVRPVAWFSRVVLWKTIDQGLVDGIAVSGSARILQGLGWLGSRLQTGQVGLYLLLFVAGAVWALGYVLR
jgi:NADH-quinone oxidoreductase subunit L